MEKIKKVISLSAFVFLAVAATMTIVQASDPEPQEVNKHLTNQGDNPCPTSGKDCMIVDVPPPGPEG